MLVAAPHGGSSLARLCTTSPPRLGCRSPSGASVFDLLWLLVSSKLQLPKADCLDFLHQRVAKAHEGSEVSLALLEVEEAISVMDRHDFEQVREAKEHVEVVREVRSSYKSAYTSKAHDITQQRSAGAKKAKRKRGGGAVVMPHHVAQGEAKNYAPPSASVWRDISRGGWCGHLPPGPRVSERFARNGASSDAALRALLVRLWAQHAEKFGQSPEGGMYSPGPLLGRMLALLSRCIDAFGVERPHRLPRKGEVSWCGHTHAQSVDEVASQRHFPRPFHQQRCRAGHHWTPQLGRARGLRKAYAHCTGMSAPHGVCCASRREA